MILKTHNFPFLFQKNILFTHKISMLFKYLRQQLEGRKGRSKHYFEGFLTQLEQPFAQPGKNHPSYTPYQIWYYEAVCYSSRIAARGEEGLRKYYFQRFLMQLNSLLLTLEKIHPSFASNQTWYREAVCYSLGLRWRIVYICSAFLG